MRTALAVSAALLLAGSAYMPAHAQMTPQAPAAAPKAQTQTQPWMAGQTQSGTMTPTQTQSYGATGGQMGTETEAPQGSYRSSCNDVRMQGQTLIAFCRNPDGTWQTSAIGPASQCAGDVQNVSGQLTCNESGVGSSTPPAQRHMAPAQPRY